MGVQDTPNAAINFNIQAHTGESREQNDDLIANYGAYYYIHFGVKYLFAQSIS